MDEETAKRAREHGVTHVGLPWYEPDSYEQVVAVMEDRHRLHATYAQWLQDALQTEQQMRRYGFVPVRAVLRPGEFEAFCRRSDCHVDAQGRTHFANLRAVQAQGGGTH